MAKQLAPLHPGEILREEFLLPLGLSPGALAKACSVPRTRIERLSNEETGVTADTALRLSKAFGTSHELWLNLQTDYDIQIAKRQIANDLAKNRADRHEDGLTRYLSIQSAKVMGFAALYPSYVLNERAGLRHSCSPQPFHLPSKIFARCFRQNTFCHRTPRRCEFREACPECLSRDRRHLNLPEKICSNLDSC